VITPVIPEPEYFAVAELANFQKRCFDTVQWAAWLMKAMHSKTGCKKADSLLLSERALSGTELG
jgi:hypothetical protein